MMMNHPPANANTILVRFRDCKTRDQVIRQRRQLKNTRITIVEDLSSLNVDLMNRLRRPEDASKCWSWNGHVYALLKDGNKLRVRPLLQKLLKLLYKWFVRSSRSVLIL